MSPNLIVAVKPGSLSTVSIVQLWPFWRTGDRLQSVGGFAVDDHLGFMGAQGGWWGGAARDGGGHEESDCGRKPALHEYESPSTTNSATQVTVEQRATGEGESPQIAWSVRRACPDLRAGCPCDGISGWASRWRWSIAPATHSIGWWRSFHTSFGCAPRRIRVRRSRPTRFRSIRPTTSSTGSRTHSAIFLPGWCFRTAREA